MESKITELFDHWQTYIQKMGKLYERLGVLLTDLGIPKGDVRIIAFISGAWRSELRFYDSKEASVSSPRYLLTHDKHMVEEHLIKLFDIQKEHTIFSFECRSTHRKAYDEFGVIHQGNENICSYGIAIEYHKLNYSKIIFELLSQICSYCKNVLDNKRFTIEEYMLANIVYVALKKQIDIDFYNTLASSHYEKKVASGGILLVSETQQCDLKIYFQETHPLDVKNVKQIRKLLEMTTDKFFLVSQNGHAVGLGDYEDFHDDFELFIFNGHQRWSYYRNNRELLSYKAGKYTFVFDNNINFISHFPINFIDENNHEYINNILHEIRLQNKGSLLIISDVAQAEVERLCMFGRGHAIAPVDLKLPRNKNLLSSVTAIDGAIFLDTNLFCYGIGMILDGIAVNTGLSARGSRYNSAQCYIDNKGHEEVTAVIFSDDETIDIIYKKEERTA